jgi:hypothetical protein
LTFVDKKESAWCQDDSLGVSSDRTSVVAPVFRSGINELLGPITARVTQREHRNYRMNCAIRTASHTLLPHECHANHLAYFPASD